MGGWLSLAQPARGGPPRSRPRRHPRCSARMRRRGATRARLRPRPAACLDGLQPGAPPLSLPRGAAVRRAQHPGPANLLWPRPTGHGATMARLPYDDPDGWRGPCPPEALADPLALVAADWEGGCAPWRVRRRPRPIAGPSARPTCRWRARLASRSRAQRPGRGSSSGAGPPRSKTYLPRARGGGRRRGLVFSPARRENRSG